MRQKHALTMTVVPAQAGNQDATAALDSRLRGNDEVAIDDFPHSLSRGLALRGNDDGGLES